MYLTKRGKMFTEGPNNHLTKTDRQNVFTNVETQEHEDVKLPQINRELKYIL